ncbi:hypothetical protein ACFFMN_40380 [Planobispora siamensis]|uniref:Uncharacterized protein n=1 Tax=Planobispora siamensis TaxID=936338 RepID=A0A8J3SNR3_9ACTN|nr:hypothetical protein [Planobispora siamensis]GIH97567.1 hypothetical protein Psi01_81970 [Planobispora siamensis]
MYANSALALTGTGMSVAATAVLPGDPAAAEATASTVSTVSAAAEGSAAAAGQAASLAVDVARTMLMITGAGFGIFLLIMTSLLAAGAVLRGVDARRRRGAVAPATVAATVTAAPRPTAAQVTR